MVPNIDKYQLLAAPWTEFSHVWYFNQSQTRKTRTDVWMRIYFSSELRQIQCTRTEFWCVQCPRPAGPSALGKHQIQASALDLSYFTSKSKCKFINLIHTRQKNKIICLCSRNISNKMTFKCHWAWRILTTLPCEKNGLVDVAFTRTITYQKHLAQSERSTRSAMDIFNTLLVKSLSENRELSLSVWICIYTFQIFQVILASIYCAANM